MREICSGRCTISELHVVLARKVLTDCFQMEDFDCGNERADE